MYCRNCGEQIDDKAVICVHCGVAVNGTSYSTEIDEEPSGGMKALAFLIPLVGLILFIMWSDKTPMKAKTIGKWALWGFILAICLTSCSSLVVMGL